MYAVVEVDRETIKASLSDEGAFVRATKEVVQKGVESFMRNLSRALFNDGSGELGTLSANSTTNGDGDTVCLISDAKEANFEERDLVDVGTSNSKQIEIVKVDPEASAGFTVILSGDVSADALSGVKLYMQGSKDADPQGLKLLERDANSAVSSSYGIDHGRRWQGVKKEAAQAAISTDMLNEMMLKIKKQCGKTPNLIVTSFKQYEKILNLLEDQKRYTINTRAGLKSKSGADISFSGVEFMSVDGPVGIFPERFVEDDRIYLLNDSHIHIHHRPDFGWFDDDGTVFLRQANSDAYEARYGGYLEVYINPCFHGVIKDLSV